MQCIKTHHLFYLHANKPERWVILGDWYYESTPNIVTHHLHTLCLLTLWELPLYLVKLPLLFWVSLCLIDVSVWTDSWSWPSQNEREKAVYTQGMHVIWLDERHGRAYLCEQHVQVLGAATSEEWNTMLTIHLCGIFSMVEQYRELLLSLGNNGSTKDDSFKQKVCEQRGRTGLLQTFHF